MRLPHLLTGMGLLRGVAECADASSPSMTSDRTPTVVDLGSFRRPRDSTDIPMRARFQVREPASRETSRGWREMPVGVVETVRRRASSLR